MFFVFNQILFYINKVFNCFYAANVMARFYKQEPLSRPMLPKRGCRTEYPCENLFIIETSND